MFHRCFTKKEPIFSMEEENFKILQFPLATSVPTQTKLIYNLFIKIYTFTS